MSDPVPAAQSTEDTAAPDPSNTPIEQLVAPLDAPAPDPSNTPIEQLVAPLDDDDDVRERIQLVNTERPQADRAPTR